MMIHVIGASGSGKTHAVMSVIRKHFLPFDDVYWPGLTWTEKGGPLPVAHTAMHKTGHHVPVALLGRYRDRKICGGLAALRRNFSLARQMTLYFLGEDHDVVSEGFLTLKQLGWMSGLDVKAIYLQTTVDECVAGIAERRSVAGRKNAGVEGSREFVQSQMGTCEAVARVMDAVVCSRVDVQQRIEEALGL